jgi:NADH pyrophosphatase NudC (nudix superfamily)
VESVLSVVVTVILTALGLGLALWGWQRYQSCPHCGRFVRRVQHGWLRCSHCGRQYRKGLRVR